MVHTAVPDCPVLETSQWAMTMMDCCSYTCNIKDNFILKEDAVVELEQEQLPFYAYQQEYGNATHT